MNLLKLTLFIVMLLFFNISRADICVNTSSNYKMFGTVLRAGALVQGQKLAFQDNKFFNYRFFSAGSPIELENQIQAMSSDSCSIILGLFTSRDCLIAGPLLVKNKIIGVSPSCSDDKEISFSPYLYTAVPQLNEFSIKIGDYLNKRNDLGLTFVIYQPTDIYSITGFNEFKKIFTKPIVEIPVTSDGQFDIKKLSYKKGKQATIIFFTYPLPSAQILTKLFDNGLISKNVRIVGSASWVFDTSVFKPIKSIFQKAQGTEVVDILDWKNIKNSTFVKRFNHKFYRYPLTIEVLNYDTTQFSIQCYKQSLKNSNSNMKLFVDCLTHGVYHGVSGPFSFNKQSPFARRQLYITNFLTRI